MPKTDPDPEFRKAFGERLRDLRTKKGWTQKELAAKLEIPATQVHRYESATNGPPPETLWQLAEALDTTTDYLLGGAVGDTRPIHSGRLLERFKALQSFSARSQETVIELIDAMIAKERTAAALRPVDAPQPRSRPTSRKERRAS